MTKHSLAKASGLRKAYPKTNSRGVPMNIRCSFCQTPYSLSRVAMLDALQEIDSKNLTHYDAHCPRCRRATQIPRQKLEMAMPNWRDELKQYEKEMKQHPQQEAPLNKPDEDAAPVLRTEPAPAKKTTGKKAAAKKSS
jgi:CRISPR/Cas system-associated protein Cas10 (large subunit of type III CRISPR-Cas system)